MPMTRGKQKEVRSLLRKKGREERGSFLVEGIRLTREAIDSDHHILEVYYSSELLEHPGGEELLQRLEKRAVPLQLVSAKALASIAETVTSQGIVALLKQSHVSAEGLIERRNGESTLVALDAVSDPGNLGSIVRTCDWFGVHGMLIGRGSVELYNPKVVRGTMGGIFHLPIAQGLDLPSVVSTAREHGYTIYVTDPRGESHFDRVTYAQKSLLVFGNEAWGVSEQVKTLAHVRLAIRRYGAAESLNVGVACGIVLSALHRFLEK